MRPRVERPTHETVTIGELKLIRSRGTSVKEWLDFWELVAKLSQDEAYYESQAAQLRS